MIFPDQALAHRLERRLAQDHHDYVRAYTPYKSGDFAEIFTLGEGVALATSLPYINSAYGVGLTSSLTSHELQQFISFFIKHQLTPQFRICPFTHPEFVTLLHNAGYGCNKFMTTYYHDLTNLPVADSAIVVTPIEAFQHPLWVETVIDRPALPDDPMTQLATTNLKREHVTGFLALLDGKAVGASAVSIQDKSAILYFTATRQHYRNRGVQTAMIQERLHYAKSQGCDMAFTTTIPGNHSMRNVLRAGFRVMYTQMILERQHIDDRE